MMKKIFASLTATAIALSAMTPVVATSAEAASLSSIKKMCHKQAKKYAKKKTSGAVFVSMLAGGLTGAAIGDAIGGRRTTATYAAGGAALGMLSGASSYQYWYDIKYEQCMDEHLY